ncbi:MAG: hypothetical protein IPP07_27230 [Holophagales bacterium]|nr:hypothetical protein [Holophagales bacterium]MBK9968357.1 hypothetical protein [Holophagales bacterium]
MGGSKHGVICKTRVGSKWIDGGTLCRTRSSAPGPLGMMLSMVMGGTPVEDEATRKKREDDKEAARQRAEDETLLKWNVELIASSPFGKSAEGVKVVRALRAYLGKRQVLYGGTLEDSRADWDSETIRLNDNYRGKGLQTIVELVHEGSHVAWRGGHLKPKDPEAARLDDEADETLARKNQLAIYTWLRANKGWLEDEGLERRLQRTGGHSGG